MSNASSALDQDLSVVASLPTLPPLLQMLRETTGMGFVTVARVTDDRWTACAVEDDIGFGLKAGESLDVDTTLCKEVRAANDPVAIDHASKNPLYCNHRTPKRYGIESYISVPIILPDGTYFGNLCALDPSPALVSDRKTMALFKVCAQLVSQELYSEARRQVALATLLKEREVGSLREEFIAVLGHDLRNPLAAVSAAAHLMALRAEEPVAVRQLAQRISANAERMRSLLDDVMDFARGRLGGGLDVGSQLLSDPEAALQQVVRELSDVHADRVIAAMIDVKQPVTADRVRLQQLCSNLLSNAITHGDPTSEIRFSAALEATDLVISVWNHGDPIPEESLSRLFEPFWRQAVGAEREGLGLGLYICSQIVQAHGGSLKVTSTREGGTLFVARLPAHQAALHVLS